MKYFKDEDLKDLWNDSQYSRENYVGEYPTDEMIAEVEAAIGGYKLPESYIELMRIQNGGDLNRDFVILGDDSRFADGMCWVSGIMGIGFDKTYALCGDLGSNFMKEEWGYPDIGVCFADTPSAGHEMYMFDYRECGKNGVPKVVHVDQEGDYCITVVANTFEEFIKSLVTEDDAEEYQASLDE